MSNMTQIQLRKLNLKTLNLESGAHDPDGKFCVMEAVAYVAREPWSDHPSCACPTLGTFLRNWNDSLDDKTRQKLKPYIPRIVGTNDGNSERRAWMCMDWLTRECGPAFMDLTPSLRANAKALRALPEITNRASLDAAMHTIRAAQKDSAAARDAARDAAWGAARDAARAAAWGAARDAACAAAWGAARDAACAAACAAAWGAASKTLAPVTKKLQKSAFLLLDRMLDLPRVP